MYCDEMIVLPTSETAIVTSQMWRVIVSEGKNRRDPAQQGVSFLPASRHVRAIMSSLNPISQFMV